MTFRRSLSPRLPAVFSVICALTPLASGHVAAQQAPQIVEVPESLPEAERAPLRVVHAKLVAMRDALRTRLAAHNSRCGRVEVGSAEEHVCKQDQSQLIRERDQYIRGVNHFNDMLRDMLRAFAGENLGMDQKKWELAIKEGLVQEAIGKALAAGVKRGELTQAQAQALGAKVLAGPAMVIKDKDDRLFLAQPVSVPNGEGEPIRTFKFVELKEGATVDSAAPTLVRNILSDRHILTALEALAAPGR